MFFFVFFRKTPKAEEEADDYIDHSIIGLDDSKIDVLNDSAFVNKNEEEENEEDQQTIKKTKKNRVEVTIVKNETPSNEFNGHTNSSKSSSEHDSLDVSSKKKKLKRKIKSEPLPEVDSSPTKKKKKKH